MRTAAEIGKIVRDLRGELSLREFAQKCDISHTTIDNLEKGIDFRTGKPTQPKTVTLQKIAKACSVPLSHILGDESSTEKPAASGEPSENVVIYHRDGKTVTRQFTKEQMDMLASMIDAIPEKPKDI